MAKRGNGNERALRGKGALRRLLLILVFALGAQSAPAQADPPVPSSSPAAPPPPAAAPALTGPVTGSFFALSVADLAATRRWYEEKLGFKLVKEGEALNGTVRFALLDADGSVLELLQHAKARPRSEAAPAAKEAFELHGLFKAGFVVRDVDAVYRQIQSRGVKIAYDMMETKDFPLRSFIVADNEGNEIQFFGK